MKFKIGDIVTWDEESDDGSTYLYTIVRITNKGYVHGFYNNKGEYCTVSMGIDTTEEHARHLTKLELTLA